MYYIHARRFLTSYTHSFLQEISAEITRYRQYMSDILIEQHGFLVLTTRGNLGILKNQARHRLSIYTLLADVI
ncbi:hypothetical protein A0H81_13270 [Grifola frondosa]|uniref:Uncharacterized protein n=1 Tax=Grifola frondosa TaxID=5627 RepID=A0A1C7LQI8_GRIFR|nr:hypothetical protein A0H81_13270 [Grifola frondosa]